MAAGPVKSTIYAIADTTTGQVRYVGKTRRLLSRRLDAHLCAGRRGGRTPICRWLRRRDRNSIEIFALEIVPDREWPEAERFWIAYLKFLGARLLNLAEGGEGADRRQPPAERADRAALMRTPEARQRVGDWSKANWAANRDAIIAAQNAGKSRAWRDKQAAFQKALWSDPNYRRRLSDVHARKLTADDVREIRKRLAAGEGVTALARSYRVDQSLISRIRDRSRWASVSSD